MENLAQVSVAEVSVRHADPCAAIDCQKVLGVMSDAPMVCGVV